MTYFVYKFLVGVRNPIQEINQGSKSCQSINSRSSAWTLYAFSGLNDWVDVNP